MRLTLFIFLSLLIYFSALPGKSFSQVDSIAVEFDSVSDRISDLETCSFKYYSEFDKVSEEYGLITHSEFGTFYLQGPDKLFIEKKGDNGNNKFFYNGNMFFIYSVDKKRYASLPSTMTLIEFIDSLSGYYGVEFPGADIIHRILSITFWKIPITLFVWDLLWLAKMNAIISQAPRKILLSSSGYQLTGSIFLER